MQSPRKQLHATHLLPIITLQQNLTQRTAQYNVVPVEDVQYFVFLHDLSLVRAVKLEQVAFVLTRCCLSIQEDRRTHEIDITHVSQIKRPIEEDARTCKVDSLQLREFIGSIGNVQ